MHISDRLEDIVRAQWYDNQQTATQHDGAHGISGVRVGLNMYASMRAGNVVAAIVEKVEQFSAILIKSFSVALFAT